MKVYRKIVIVLALVLGLFYCGWLISSPTAQTAIRDPVTEEYYEMLEKYAMNVARTLDVEVLTDETVTANFYYSGNVLVVTVESFKAKVIAYIPVSNYEINIEDREFTSHGIAEFEKVEFVKSSDLNPAWWYIVMAIAGGAFVAFAVWAFLYKTWRRMHQ